MAEWFVESEYLILLRVPDEETLLDFADAAVRDRIPFHLQHEPDFAGLPGGWHTALCLAPSEASRRLCANLPLALREAMA